MKLDSSSTSSTQQIIQKTGRRRSTFTAKKFIEIFFSLTKNTQYLLLTHSEMFFTRILITDTNSIQNFHAWEGQHTKTYKKKPKSIIFVCEFLNIQKIHGNKHRRAWFLFFFLQSFWTIFWEQFSICEKRTPPIKFVGVSV